MDQKNSYEYYYNMVKNDPLTIDDVPESLIDIKLIWAILEENYENIYILRNVYNNSVAKKYKLILSDPKIKAIWRVWNRGESIRYIPADLIDEKLAILSVSCNNDKLEKYDCIPKCFLTKNFYMVAMRFGGDLSQVPSAFIDLDMCKLAVIKNGINLKFVPQNYLSDNFYFEAIHKNPEILRYIPEKDITYDMCLSALTIGMGRLLAFVPKQFKDLNICKIALKKDGRVISYCPPELQTTDLLEKTVNSCASAIAEIPDDKKTYSMCVSAVKVNYHFLKYVPHKFKDRLMYLYAASGITKFDPSGGSLYLYFENLPEIYKNESFYYEAIKMQGENIRYRPTYISVNFFTEKVYKEAVFSNGSSLAYVPKNIWSFDLCKQALMTKPYAHSQELLGIIMAQVNTYIHLNKEEITELCLIAVKHAPSAIRSVPLENRTTDLYKLVKNRIKNCKQYFPKDVISIAEQEISTNAKLIKEDLYTPALEEKIISLIKDNPSISKTEVARILQIPVNKADTLLKKLRTEGIIPKYFQNTPVQNKILTILNTNPTSRKELIVQTGCSEKSIENALTTLKKKGLITNLHGIWQLI